MLIPLEILKVIQAAGVLLCEEPSRRLSRLRLLKYLYIADRESLTDRARPITGDAPVAMDHGPVLIATFGLLEGSDVGSPEWDKYFGAEGRDVLLRSDPGLSKLTRYEIGKLQDVSRRFVENDDDFVADYTHSFAEWIKNKPDKGSVRDIPVEDVLDATGLSAVKDRLVADFLAEREVVSRLF